MFELVRRKTLAVSRSRSAQTYNDYISLIRGCQYSYLLRTIVIYGFICIRVQYAPILGPHHIHVRTALDIRMSRYEYVYWSAHVHVWICICIPWRGQTLHIIAYGTMSRSALWDLRVPLPVNDIFIIKEIKSMH